MSIVSKTGEYAKIAFGYTKRVIAPFFFGITLNWVFALVFFIGALSSISFENGIFRLILIAVFLAGFPFLYFWLARGYAVKKGLELVYKGSEGVVAKAVGVVVSATVTEPSDVQNSSIFNKKNAVKGAVSFIKQINDKLPRSIRRILRFVLEQVPIQAMILEVGDEMALTSENLEEIKPKVQEKVDSYVVNELIGADLTWFWGLAIINIAIMFLSWYYL
jgi:hypothetical protein